MYRWIRDKYKSKAHLYFYDKEGRVYSFRRRRGIYQAVSPPRKKDCDKQDVKSESLSFFSLKARRKWLAIVVPNIIGIATFGVVAEYTYYAAQQVAASENANDAARQANRYSDKGLFLTLKKMSEQIKQTQRLSSNTRTLALAARDQATATNTVAETSSKSFAIAQQQLDSSERPWIKGEMKLVTPEEFVAPAWIDNGRNFVMAIEIAGLNVGKSPATRVIGNATLISDDFRIENIRQKQLELCDLTAIQTVGETIFPGDPYSITLRPYLASATIEKEIKNPSNGEYRSVNGVLTSYPSVSLIGCIVYTTDFSKERKHTTFYYHVENVVLRDRDARNPVLLKGQYANDAN